MAATLKTGGLAVSREVAQTLSGVGTSDGNGVKLTRFIGSRDLNMLDPFLLLDLFQSDEASDYIGGFPSHPHRGFQTVTYMLAGRMRHKDNAGHEGVIEPGGVQWMNAGRGVIHSEMPEQESGLLSGFQLWVNLPAADKMSPPTYQEFAAADIPVESRAPGVGVKVIAGRTDFGTVGPVEIPATDPRYFDVDLEAGAVFSQNIPQGHNGFIHVIGGGVVVGGEAAELTEGTLGVLGPGDRVQVLGGEMSSRFLLVAGRELDEPVARGGPFVMTTRQQIIEAFEDYRAGRF
ncbi:Pirin [hydrothermal vent metagenome]|uniref:Pirin n=1 Tax=hydrothermal vent metagenome TaxID=652676 RepID=A0A3B0TWC6_9ZZZZ